MELNKEQLLKLEVITVNKALFKQIRYWSGETLKDTPIEVTGWADFEGTWVVGLIGGQPGRMRATDYVVARVDRTLWRDGVTLQVMDKFPQVFVR